MNSQIEKTSQSTVIPLYIQNPEHENNSQGLYKLKVRNWLRINQKMG